MGELLGYARVSTLEQNADLQRDALGTAGCWRVFTDHVATDLAAREVGFRSLTESIDTTTPGGRLIFHTFGALAQFSSTR